ncbi:uncharacterized protein DUF4194 [Dermabacter hominis]
MDNSCAAGRLEGVENEKGPRMREHEETAADGRTAPAATPSTDRDEWALASDDEDLTYAGSTGGALVEDSRRVLVALLQGPYLDGRRDPQRYGQLLRDRAYIEQRLADMFLELVLDDDAQVAFVRQSEDDPDAPKLLRRLTGLNRLDTVLLLVLRQHLLTQSSRGQRAVVSEMELVSTLSTYRRTDSTDEAGFTKDIRSSIAKLQRAGLLEEQGDSYEVSPVLKLMITPDTAREFIDLYMRAGDDVGGAADALDREAKDDTLGEADARPDDTSVASESEATA